MATTKFYLRSKGKSCAIQMQLSVSQTLKMRTSTGLTINSNDWSKETNFPKQGKDPGIKNTITKLKELEVEVLKEFNIDFTNGVVFSNEWLKSKINKYFDRKTSIMDDDNFNYSEIEKITLTPQSYSSGNQNRIMRITKKDGTKVIYNLGFKAYKVNKPDQIFQKYDEFSYLLEGLFINTPGKFQYDL